MHDLRLLSQDSAVSLSTTGVLDRAELTRIEIGHRLAQKGDKRSRLGQFFTPATIARFMASMLRPQPLNAVRILDAGAGIGMLSLAAVEAICSWEQPPSTIEVDLWEIDEDLGPTLCSVLDQCMAATEDAGIRCQFRIKHSDFIKDAVSCLSMSPLFGTEHQPYNIAILNPPYRKLRNETDQRRALSSINIETSNLYSAFTWLSLKLLADGGDLVAITPRSYMNGTYFRPFRHALREGASIRRIHVYDSRTKSFASDDVLQENAILHAVKMGESQPCAITTSDGPDDIGYAIRNVEPDQLILADDKEAIIHVVPDEIEAAISEQMRLLPFTLAKLGLGVSTGRVVAFRAKSRLMEQPGISSAPLIFPRHLTEGAVRWPVFKNGKPNAIATESEHDPLLMPSGWYVLVKRFSAKEEAKRIVASIFNPEKITATEIGFDNKLNVIHLGGQGITEQLARGVAVYLNSTFVDSYFRQFSGHTQVNAGDLRSIRFPSRKELEAIGCRTNGRMPSLGEINCLVLQEIDTMNKKSDPIAPKQKIVDAVEILKALNAPKAQQNERSALTLLGLLNLTPGKAWTDAEAPLRGVTEQMDWMAENYGKKYAPNTRETIRRFTLHQFIEMGLVHLNPDKPDRPPNSPKNVYQIESTARELLKTFGTSKWEKHLAGYTKSMQGINRLRPKSRNMKTIPVALPDGNVLDLSAGGQNVLIKSIVEEFAPRFTPGGRVLYLGDAGAKHLLNDTAYFAKLGVEIEPHGKMPDVVIHFTDRDWLVLVEAVTSHGPVNMLRHNHLRDLFAGSKAGLVYVTAFVDRKTMREYLPEIAWETEVWVADAPEHLIHFNGERFLGPYDS